MHLISQFRRKKLYNNFDNFSKAVFNVNEYQLEYLSEEREFLQEMYDFMSYMQIQNETDEYAR